MYTTNCLLGGLLSSLVLKNTKFSSSKVSGRSNRVTMKEADNVSMLLQSSESAESSSSAVTKRKNFASMFIPTSSNRSFDYENQHVRQAADSPQSVNENPTVSIRMRGLLTAKNNKEIEMAKCTPEEPEYRLITGPLGMCTNLYCMICPTYCRQKKKFRDVQDGEPKRGTRKFIHGAVNPHSKIVQWWDRVFLISCFLATFVDPLFFFLPCVQQENKCVVFDWTLAWVIMVLRSSSDLVYLLHMLLQFRLAYISPVPRAVGFGVLIVDPKKIVHNYLLSRFWIDLCLVLPLPQIMTMLVRTNILPTGAIATRNVLCFIVIFQYIPRLCRFLPMLIGRSPNGLIFETAWANFVINLLSFVLAGHAVGSLWYLLGLQRVNRCLMEACDASDLGKNYTGGCNKLIDCLHNSNKTASNAINKPVPWRNYTGAISCFTADGFSYGIYIQAVKLTSTGRSLGIRYTYSLFWGFQQLSTLAGNQTPSYVLGEVLFTMGIVGFGLLLFALLIGNMQNFLQALGRRRLDMMLRQRDFEQWMSHRHLPNEIKEKIRNAEKHHWMANRGVDEEKLMVILPEDLQTEIQRHLLNKFLKNVRIFRKMDQPVLDSISERLRQKTYITGYKILFPRCPIKRMTFIVDGEMESISEDGSVAQLSAGDVCGEELLTWYLEESAGNQETILHRITKEGPVSNRTVRCVTNVEAFVLEAADLKEVTCLFPKSLTKPRLQKAIRLKTTSLAVRRIQATWRNKKERQVQSKTAGISPLQIVNQV